MSATRDFIFREIRLDNNSKNVAPQMSVINDLDSDVISSFVADLIDHNVEITMHKNFDEVEKFLQQLVSSQSCTSTYSNLCSDTEGARNHLIIAEVDFAINEHELFYIKENQSLSKKALLEADLLVLVLPKDQIYNDLIDADLEHSYNLDMGVFVTVKSVDHNTLLKLPLIINHKPEQIKVVLY